MHAPSTQIGIDSGTRNIFASMLHGLDSMYGRFSGLHRTIARGALLSSTPAPPKKIDCW
jgi:hypothetical protein